MEQRIAALCGQLLKAEDITVIEIVAEELQKAIQAHVEQHRRVILPKQVKELLHDTLFETASHLLDL